MKKDTRYRNASFLLRIFFIPISLLSLLFFIRQFIPYLNDLLDKIYAPEHQLYDYIQFGGLILIAAAGISHLILEILHFQDKDITAGYFLRHLRYGAMTALLLSVPLTVGFDFGMVEYSKSEIRNYIHERSNDVSKPEDVYLHITYRSWCGNGISANINNLYKETAASGLDSKIPETRIRSLYMSHAVRDWINGKDVFYDDVMFRACSDIHERVVSAAEELLNQSNSGCFKYGL